MFVSELINFMKKENFINKLKEKEDKDYLPFIHLLESLIKKLPDLGIYNINLVQKNQRNI